MKTETMEAMKKSLAHHEENLRLLCTLEGVFSCSFIGHKFVIGDTKVWFDAEHCALCRMFNVDCTFFDDNDLIACPLDCTGDGSRWKQLGQAITKNQAIRAEENLINHMKDIIKENEK